MSKATFDVLVIDDDELVPELVSLALGKLGDAYRVRSVSDGAAALAHLRGTQERNLPNVILLDLNMPQKNGFDLLEALRSNPALQHLVVFVMSTSDTSRDRKRAYALGVSGYLVKSRLGPQLCELAKLIEAYCKTVLLPV